LTLPPPAFYRFFTKKNHMDTRQLIKGIHHVTATVNDAIEDFQFYTQTLGMRLVKKTVNFDNHNVYHFYYADQVGTPGTVFTTFPYKGQANVKQGLEGSGQIVTTALSVSPDSLGFWAQRLQEQGTLITHGERFGQAYLWFRDPAGLQIELIGDADDQRTPWHTADILDAYAVRGIHHTTLSIAPDQWAFMLELLQNEMNMAVVAEESNRVRLSINGGGAGAYLEMRKDSYARPGKNGIGTVHHVAFKVENDEALYAMQDRLTALELKPTEMRDRKYFHSVYFKPQSSMWFELATMGPGFTIDEPEAELGQLLLLPDWEEPHRAAIEAVLPPLK
jgi:glyoxalase family protein